MSSEIQEALHELAGSRLTPAVLNALDFVVPGEWDDSHSLEEVIEHTLEITDPVQIARIKERAERLYAEQPHYSRALKVFRAADSVDKAAAAAVMASKAGSAISLFGLLERFTPKPDTTQALDATMKITAEVLAFALLRGIPVTSLTEAKAFPATLATYARADLMRLGAWLAIDGMLPLGPDFVDKIKETLDTVDTSKITNNALFKQLKDLIPGSSDEDHKNFVLATFESGQEFIGEFVRARGIEPEDIMDALGSAMEVAESGAELLAATLDATTNYYAHTGVQSVARVLVHDASEALEGEPMPVAGAEGEAGLSPWFKGAAATAVGAGAGLAIGGMMLRRRGEGAGGEEGGGAWFEDDDVDADGDGLPDIGDNAFMARELAAEMLDREVEDLDDPDVPGGAMTADQAERRDRLRARRRRRMQRMQQMREQRGGRGGRGGGGGGGGRGGRRGRRQGPNRRAQRMGQLKAQNDALGGEVRKRRGRRRRRGGRGGGGGGGGGRGGGRRG